ncbi:hypothetical protein K227x_37290 [Rubripirellula lacrimiformis]|uniref:site-specific DNA-methyltransferase (cytosine-N(4)-specific) n=1 Tax=Rubripirellula lacrimiformis TaxID=1930273 RepID=A0A517NDX6_9BACT|nr:hypothetical protein [Rubripirellula lacrimiformis]QDT05329.1 hypothetical protein K227x_37290 [Rubripirellula lacrimiformis]
MMTSKKKSAKLTRQHPSPFFSRSYGGYTSDQIDFFASAIGESTRKRTIVDPMGGQGVALSRNAWKGDNVWLGDINPALSFMACLRSPKLILNYKTLAEGLRKKVHRLNRKRRKGGQPEYVDDWFAPTIRDDLYDFGQLANLSMFDDPFGWDNDFWRTSEESQFEIGIVLLAAREFACCRSTDNPTWSKPGGIPREFRLAPTVLRALSLWEAFAEENVSNISSKRIGTLTVQRTNAAKCRLYKAPKAHAIITSPPYANRLDYTKLWAPESEALACICNRSMTEIRREQIGSTVMRGKSASFAENPKELPRVAERVLDEIKKDKSASSANYYYPFFRSYAEGLTSAMECTAERLKKDGVMVVFVRDTVRKDILFPTGQIVIDVLESTCGLELVSETKKIIKGHVGQLRQKAKSGLYGLAQQEWWLAFRRPA